MRFGLCVLALSVVCAAGVKTWAAEEALVIEQDYNIVNPAKKGMEAKDVRQKLFISRDWVCIDEGDKHNRPTETILLDLKNKQIIDLNHEDKMKVTESFEARRKRIEERVKIAEEDLRDQPDGPQKNKLEKLYSALLDARRRFVLVKDATGKNVAGVDCHAVKIVDEKEPDYIAFEAQLHPALALPYDNTEALYLLQLMGKGLADFLHANKEQIKFVPMELHMELAIGGHLDTKVVSVKNVPVEELSALRGGLGNPFMIPDGYTERPKYKVPAPKPTKEEKPD